MRIEKFTLNSLIIVIMLITGIFFFFTVKVVDISDHTAVNDYVPVEGSEVSVCYSNLRPNGIYVGDKITGELKVPGDFGHDWGAAAVGSTLYINEYTVTTFNIMKCSLVKVDLDSFEKSPFMSDAMLRGRCASGELVVIAGYAMPTSYPKVNPLIKLYSFSSPTVRPEDDGALVMYLDPASGEVVYSVHADKYLMDNFEGIFLERSLEEVRG